MNSSNKINLLSIIGLLFISLFLVSCQPVTCNEPYILVGDSCCLDQDNNSICDFDDALIPEPEQEELGAQEVFELVEDSMYLVELRCDYVWETPTYELELSDLPRDEYEVDLVETDSLYPTDDFGYFQGAGFVVDGVLYSANHNVGCGTNDYELEMEWYMFELTDLYNLGYVLTWEDLIDFVEESTFDDQINEIFSYYEDYFSARGG